ncbi:hypothetical protein MMC17_000200 [Xylographa soralifera]|nr:hypothetical protein [Xylographa soralifera]
MPIVLYLAYAPYILLTQGNGTLDQEWAQCLGCATIDRSFNRLGMERTLQCQSCIAHYCWDGESVPDEIMGLEGGMHEVTQDVDLEMVLRPGISFAQWNATHPL